MNLTDFTCELRGFLIKPWKFTDRKLAVVSDARILLARTLSAKDKYEEATGDARDKFAVFLDIAHGPKTAEVSASKLKRWAGPLRKDAEEGFPLMIPGEFMGTVLNRMQIAKALKIVDEKSFTASIVSLETGPAALFTGKKWRILLMACREGALKYNNLKRGETVRKFAYA